MWWLPEPFGVGRSASFERRERSCAQACGRAAIAGVLTSSRVTDRTSLPSDESRGRVLVRNLKRVGGVRSSSPTDGQGPGVPGAPTPLGVGAESTGGKEAGDRLDDPPRKALERRPKSPGEHRPSEDLRVLSYGTDLRREQSPGVAGHLDLLVLRAVGCDVRNGKRVVAPKGVPLCGGEKLWRVNPKNGTGLRGREARREETVKRVRNPEGGTCRGWNPG